MKFAAGLCNSVVVMCNTAAGMCKNKGTNNSGYFVTQQRLRAVHALRSDQLFVQYISINLINLTLKRNWVKNISNGSQ